MVDQNIPQVEHQAAENGTPDAPPPVGAAADGGTTGEPSSRRGVIRGKVQDRVKLVVISNQYLPNDIL
jgi:hypothetical protein